MQIINHKLTGIKHGFSPNFDERPDPGDIALLVLHCISLPPNEFGADYIDRLFANQLNPAEHPYFETIHQIKVSAHVLIRRSGEIIQYVPFDKRAWHAGPSLYQGRSHCNDFSIGIELEGTETVPYTEIQYRQLAAVITCLFEQYPLLSKDTLTGHSDIAPGRKTDPGIAFDWAKLFDLLAENKTA
ncbi:MAG: 1,6-anhydro-N-acetylmuramyl-L-alanine amidase AmpD [Gammaproteobacteria bacterium HGW-Gammaproteobacteria-3]|jgi:AmpD protein|nr:MAG: 1,6-anhydro-N-acetylmuramyl-L-alanine amidase AmpD [Gammaproteobacteria bacterium HGW-Gammaproteobacteria-3]